ncbi:MAG: alpha/beta fold hydrolase [Betaproteobacteria bacterium]|nr:alpha/beta fold hydrolase [Betaproteobacteria bacterium]
MLINIALVVAAFYAILVLLLFFMQSRLLYYPEIGRDVTTTPRAIGLDYEDVWLDAGSGVRLHGWFVGQAEPKGVVLILHGNAGSIALRLDWLRMFHDLGYASFVVDYRGYGRSSGTPSEQGTYEDARLAWAHLTKARGFAPGDIVLLGESLGGAIAAYLAARESPRVLILHSAFTSIPDVAAQIYRFLPVRWISRFDYDTRAYLGRVRSPVVVAHSPSDEIIPVSHGQALYAAAPEPKIFIELAGGHNDGFIFRRREWLTALAQFLERVP